MAALVAAAVSLGIWLYLLAGRAGFWRVKVAPSLVHDANRTVAVVIPARNETAVIGKAVISLLAQNYSGRLHIIVVDDHSSDDTSQIALRAARSTDREARLRVIKARPLPSGWTGKLWAISEGLSEARSVAADYFLLTDADIVHGPSSVTNLVARAEAHNYDLVSLMVKLHCETFPERLLIPAFVFFFLMLYPPSWIARKGLRTAGAAGGCILIRPSALVAAGGISAIRTELIDDCALARAVKRSGGSLWLGLTSETISIRRYTTFAEIGSMISRTAFTQLRHSTLLLFGILLAMALTFAIPVALSLAGTGAARILGLSAWLLMSALYSPICRFYRAPILWTPLLPAIALFYTGATIHSAISYWLGRGGQWKNRVQDLS
jgi:hopene-associated glycosyltransferase HpnB